MVARRRELIEACQPVLPRAVPGQAEPTKVERELHELTETGALSASEFEVEKARLKAEEQELVVRRLHVEKEMLEKEDFLLWLDLFW